MERKLQTQVGRRCMRHEIHRGTGIRTIKQARGFRQFLLRGLEKVREWALICMIHNILKFHKIICSG